MSLRVHVFLFAAPDLAPLPSPPSLSRDAVVLSTACKPLHAAVAASKWPPYSPLPLIAADCAVSEPPSGRFSVICWPEEGEVGILRAIHACKKRGSILLRVGIYSVTDMLRVNRRVHIFGRGRAELKGMAPSFIIKSNSPSATLDQLRIDSQTESFSHPLDVYSGNIRVQCCDVSSCAFLRREFRLGSLRSQPPCRQCPGVHFPRRRTWACIWQWCLRSRRVMRHFRLPWG